MNPRPCFQALQYHFFSLLLLVTLLFLFIQIIKIYFYHPYITLVSLSLRRTSAPIQFAIVLGVLGTQETPYYLVAGLFERDHLLRTPPTD